MHKYKTYEIFIHAKLRDIIRDSSCFGFYLSTRKCELVESLYQDMTIIVQQSTLLLFISVAFQHVIDTKKFMYCM